MHEIKFDGYRIVAFIKSGKVTLRTRNGLDWTAKFPGIARALAGLKVDSAIIDGEAVVLDEEGRSDFQGAAGDAQGENRHNRFFTPSICRFATALICGKLR